MLGVELGVGLGDQPKFPRLARGEDLPRPWQIDHAWQLQVSHEPCVTTHGELMPYQPTAPALVRLVLLWDLLVVHVGGRRELLLCHHEHILVQCLQPTR